MTTQRADLRGLVERITTFVSTKHRADPNLVLGDAEALLEEAIAALSEQGEAVADEDAVQAVKRVLFERRIGGCDEADAQAIAAAIVHASPPESKAFRSMNEWRKHYSTPTEQRVLNRALMASVEIVDAPSPTASDDIFAPDVGPTASIIGFAPTASDEKGCAECESPAGIHAEGCASRDPSEKIHSGANVSSKIERAITCATQGHLWGPLGKCVMCEEPRPTASREGEFINSDAVNAAFEKFAPEVSFEDASQIVRAIRAALSTPPHESREGETPAQEYARHNPLGGPAGALEAAQAKEQK